MKARFYLLFIFFLLFSATTYISNTSSARLKSNPFYWSSSNIHVAGTILIFIQFFAVFLGGFMAVFIIPVPILLGVGFSALLIAVLVYEAAFLSGKVNGTAIIVDITKDFFSENSVGSVVVFFVLFGIYSGLCKFMLLVMMLDQDGPRTVDQTVTSYLFAVNLSYIFVFDFFPSSTLYYEFYFTFSMPLILFAIVLLLLGRWRNTYRLNSKQLNIIQIVHGELFKSETPANFIVTFSRSNEVDPIMDSNLAHGDVSNNPENSKQALLSFTKLCIVFVTLLPYGVCESQLRTTYMIQSNYLLQPETEYYAMKGGFWVQTINCLGVLVFIIISAILRRFSCWFHKLYSNRMGRIITSYIFIFLSIMAAALVETIRLIIHEHSHSAQIIDGNRYNATNMSVFYMTPQLLFSSISEILLITTCVEFMYQQSVGSMKYLAVAFFMGAAGSGGAGDLISLILTLVLTNQLFDPADLNRRTMVNGTLCVFESRLDYWFYGLGTVFFLSVILNVMLLKKFKYYYDPKKTPDNLSTNSNLLND